MNNLKLITDQNLYQLCKTYGERALEWRRKFIGLLPEVNRRKLYEKKGFGSIFEFAKKLAGLSEEQVRRVLNIEEKFENVPVLKELLVNGEVSMNKLARVASIANLGNQEFLAERVRILSQGALETMVRDERWGRKFADESLNDGNPDLFGCKNRNGLFKPEIKSESVRAHTFDGGLNLSFEVQEKLFELQQKGLDLNNLLLEFLQKREEEIEQRKEKIAEKVLQMERKKAEKASIISQGRYICQDVRKILREEFGKKCSIRNCQKPAKIIHHTQRFSLSKSNDPRYLAPLCNEHHELAHAVDMRYQEIRSRCKR
jgi:hypothetical protein